jgi:hypothetical protein
MLYVSTDITKFSEFCNIFSKTHEKLHFINLSKIPTANLAEECDSIVKHHKSCCIFLGYLEPGWMLEMSHQTRIRTLMRSFPVAIVTNYIESLPYSWKNEIDILYVPEPLNKNGNSNSLDDGRALQHEPNI